MTTARATTEGKEQRRRKLRAEIGAGVFKRNGGMTACMCNVYDYCMCVYVYDYCMCVYVYDYCMCVYLYD